jgi:hypothetical protein
MRKVLLLSMLILALAPGTWLRSPWPPADDRQILSFGDLAVGEGGLGPLEPAGAWVLDSPNDAFGSYSALAALDDGTLLAASDKGSMMQFAPPGTPGRSVRIGYFGQDRSLSKWQLDIESMTRDPASGRLWLGFEGSNRIERLDAGFRAPATVQPDAMRGWPSNQGPEAMVRLADGRFVVIAEGTQRWFAGEVPGLLFPSDPVAGAEPLRFRFDPPAGYRAVDMAQLPDGRVLILLRKVLWRIPPGFAGKLMVADPRTIRAGKPWRAEPLADLAALPSDNYEGLAVMPDGKGGTSLWLISDDNDSIAQRTLLLRLHWPAKEKRAGIPARLTDSQ